VKAAAGNSKEVIALLLNQRGDQNSITEEVAVVRSGEIKGLHAKT
jgi:hypothetical protein